MIPYRLPIPESNRNLPDGWKAEWNTRYREWYYVNVHTKQSQWQRPNRAAETPRRPANELRGNVPRRLPAGWKAEWDAKYKEWYYANTYTKQSQWEKPTEPARSSGGLKLTPSVASPPVRNERRTTTTDKQPTTEPARSSPRANSKPNAIPSASINGAGDKEMKKPCVAKPAAVSRDTDHNLDGAPAATSRSLETTRVKMLYKKLPEKNFVRVLQLNQGLRSDPLSGVLLQPIGLDWSLKYEAVSYRWSEVDPKNPALIEIDGTKFPIGPGLHAALLQFRDQRMPRLLWIDQICINQTDPVEKIAQIEIMGDIYANAKAVVIWLGEASDQSDAAMEFFPILMEQVRRDHETSKSQQLAGLPRNIIQHSGTLATVVDKLFSRPWFGRVWTLQEAAFGQEGELWCGQKSFPYQLLEEFQRSCDNDEFGHWANVLQLIESGSGVQDPENPRRALMTHLHIVSLLKREPKASSVRVLNSLRSLDCLQDEDRVYSVLRFLSPDLVDRIVRKKKASPADLYYLVASHELLNGQREYLGAGGLSQQRMSYKSRELPAAGPCLVLPSWVPDWTYRIRAHSYWVQNRDCLQKTGKPLYIAGGSAEYHSNGFVSIKEDILHMDGAVIDEVGECEKPFRVAKLPEDLSDHQSNATIVQTAMANLQSYIASCMKLAQNCSETYGRANIEAACRHSLVGGMMPGQRGTIPNGVLVRASVEVVNSLFEDFEELVSYFERLTQEIEWFQSLDQTGGMNEEDRTRMEKFMNELQNRKDVSMNYKLLSAIAEACKGRRFFITRKERRMGVAPDITKPGDKICVIPGCCAPFVIRPRGDRYQLVGECYVAGIMDGEVMYEKNMLVEELAFE